MARKHRIPTDSTGYTAEFIPGEEATPKAPSIPLWKILLSVLVAAALIFTITVVYDYAVETPAEQRLREFTYSGKFYRPDVEVKQFPEELTRAFFRWDPNTHRLYVPQADERPAFTICFSQVLTHSAHDYVVSSVGNTCLEAAEVARIVAAEDARLEAGRLGGTSQALESTITDKSDGGGKDASWLFPAPPAKKGSKR